MTASPAIDNTTLTIYEEIHVRASLDATFAAILEEISTHSQAPDGSPMSMKIEPWPGGRWYRDLGNQNGHLWGHVQAIKSPSLLEISGPLFMSYAVVNNVQYRLSEEPGGALIKFRHTAFGMISDEHRTGVAHGWGHIHSRLVARFQKDRLN